MVKLDDDRIRWIIKCRDEGIKNADIADVQKITVRRVQQIYSSYRKNSKLPVLKSPGRPTKPVTVQEIDMVRQVHKRFRANAVYLERYIRKIYGIKINHNRIHGIMLDEGLSVEQPRKKMRRKWIRYEREHSNSLWHVDWHTIKDPRWEEKQLIAYEDDASRFITGYGVSDDATSKNSVTVLEEAVKRYGRPASILSDNGAQFTTNERDSYDGMPTSFEHYLIKHHIKHRRSRVHHPQTNGKLEKFFDIFERKVIYFKSIPEFMEWYNHIRPHGALDLDEMETPASAYYSKMATNDVLVDPEILWRNWS
ncbi:MAG: DDE-type integrase/transposase/recombinase [Nitrosopumilaceae archaeon]